MSSIDNVTLCNIADDIFQLYCKERDCLLYEYNVINELHIGENVHSRILCMLLQYKIDGKYPIYSSLVSFLSKICSSIDEWMIKNPQFINEEGRNDILIEDFSRLCPYAFIIENKECDTTDNSLLYQRFVDDLRDDYDSSISLFRVSVKDGEQSGGEDTLTEDYYVTGCAQENVYALIREYYIHIDYKHHILPWLEKYVLPNPTIKERILVAFVRLYVDYLKAMFNMRDGKRQITYKIHSEMKEKYNVRSLDDSIELYKKVDILKKESSSLLIEYIEDTLDKKLYTPLLNAFPGCEIIKVKIEQESRFGFSIKLREWKKCKICLTWDEEGQYFGITHIDYDKDWIDTCTCDRIHEVLPNGNDSDLWPWRKRLKNHFSSADSIEIWRDVENGRVFSFFQAFISKAINQTKDFQNKM